MTFDGYLLVDKPMGWSSFDVVAKTRVILSKEYFEQYGEKKKVKVGHTGTLDPLASGLMLVVVGSYCKRASELSKLDKTYQVTMKLGETSSTGDEEGEKKHISDEIPENDTLVNALENFVGEIMQTPPAYSAVKVNGERAYKLARAGKEVKIEPRKVKIYSIDHINYSYPLVEFTASVSSGTYIRSLVEDVGKSLGVGAYMTGLNRSMVGEFNISDAINIDGISVKKLKLLTK